MVCAMSSYPASSLTPPTASPSPPLPSFSLPLSFKILEQVPLDLQALTSSRLIEPWQKGETATFMEHARLGVQSAMVEEAGSVVVFSG